MSDDETWTSWTERDGSVSEGTACSRCGSSYETCTRKLRTSHGSPCCSTCHNTNTHRERPKVIACDPAVTAPQAGDTVLYTAENGAQFGGVVEEAIPPGLMAHQHRFRIIGHDSLFFHEAAEWKARKILRPVRRLDDPGEQEAVDKDAELTRARMTFELNRALGNEPMKLTADTAKEAWTKLLNQAENLVAETSAQRDRLAVIDRKVDHPALARELFVARMKAAYPGVSKASLRSLYRGLNKRDEAAWMTVVDEAVRQLLATDMAEG